MEYVHSFDSKAMLQDCVEVWLRALTVVIKEFVGAFSDCADNLKKKS